MARAWMAGLAALCALVLGGCGGGGGGGEGGGQTPLAITFSPAAVNLTGVVRNPLAGTALATIRYTPGSLLYLAVEAEGGLIADVQGTPSGGDSIELAITFNALPEGLHTDELLLHACLDEACTREAGPPGRLPIRVQMLPNLAGPAAIQLQRSGREPAPSASVPLTIPAEAGEVELSVESAHPSRFAATLSGSTLDVQTRQEQAGRYDGVLRLRSRSDPRYFLAIPIDYTVLAPPGGEQPMTVSPTVIEVQLNQGEVQTRRITVTRATWTDALDPPVITSDSIATVRDLGNDEFEVTFDARNVPRDTWYSSVVFSAGPTGNVVATALRAQVDAPLRLNSPLQWLLDASSTAADLRLSTPVLTPDGAAVPWFAASRTDWMRVLTPTGITGVDALQIEIDASALPRLPFVQSATLELRLDRAGTQPMTVEIPLANYIPRIDAASRSVLGGTRGRIYLQGMVPPLYGDLATSARLRVEGARLVQASLAADPRYVGTLAVLQVDVDQAAPGTDITLRIDSPLMPTQAVVRVEPPVKVPVGYAALPLDSYRPASHLPGRRTVLFAGRDRVHAWRHDAAGWTLSGAALPGLIDIAAEPNEARWIALTGRDTVVALDPASMAELGRSSLAPFSAADSAFDAQAPEGTHALAFAADLRAFGSKKGLDPALERYGVAWLAGSTRSLDLLDAPVWSDPGTSLWSTAHSGIVRSADGQALGYELGVGRWMVYQASARAPQELQGLQHTAPLAAISDDARTLVWADGLARLAMGTLVDLKRQLPATHMAGGYALSPSGGIALIYGYRQDVEGGVPRARDPRLWLVSLTDIAPGIRVIGDVALPDAVGCTSGTPAPGEACEHRAMITVSADGGSAFVLGPRGIAAVPLPDGVSASGAPRAGAAGSWRRLPLTMQPAAPLR